MNLRAIINRIVGRQPAQPEHERRIDPKVLNDRRKQRKNEARQNDIEAQLQALTIEAEMMGRNNNDR